METWFENIPKYSSSPGINIAGTESVIAEGVIEVQKRRMKSERELFDFTDVVGVFKRENGATSYGIIESDIAHLNGCRVRVKIEVLELPKAEEV
jgi:hypothetical protein